MLERSSEVEGAGVARVLTPSLQAEEMQDVQLVAALEPCTGDQLLLNPGCTAPQGPCSSQHLEGEVKNQRVSGKNP